MNTLFKFRLYSTSHCHLCDLSKEMLFSVIEKNSVEIIDIAEDTQWLNKYELTIPVLQNVITLQELKWPFTINEVQHFIAL